MGKSIRRFINAFSNKAQLKLSHKIQLEFSNRTSLAKTTTVHFSMGQVEQDREGSLRRRRRLQGDSFCLPCGLKIHQTEFARLPITFSPTFCSFHSFVFYHILFFRQNVSSLFAEASTFLNNSLASQQRAIMHPSSITVLSQRQREAFKLHRIWKVGSV